MSKEEQLKQLYELLLNAIPAIEPKYMIFEAVGLLDGFMERTYAYEFYHQLRRYQDELKYTDFTIHAEPEKARTQFLERILERLEAEKLENENIEDFQKRVMPDLLVHSPNNINDNIAIIEIKPEKGNVSPGFKKDIRVLKEFIDGGEDADGYLKGIYILYSTPIGIKDPDEIKN